MAAKDEKPAEAAETSAASTSADEQGPEPPLAKGPAPGVGRYSVTLHCPTPLVVECLECEATSESDAKSQFNKANGITSTIHPYTVTRL